MTYDRPPPFHTPVLLETPTSAQRDAFVRDRNYFEDRANTKRRFAMRPVLWNEMPGDHHVYQRPTLYVCVARMSPALHVVTPVWWGFAIFEVTEHDQTTYVDARNDDEIAAILANCCERGWYDEAAWLAHRP